MIKLIPFIDCLDLRLYSKTEVLVNLGGTCDGKCMCTYLFRPTFISPGSLNVFIYGLDIPFIVQTNVN